jgi:parallel beta-helix repeat protein
VSRSHHVDGPTAARRRRPALLVRAALLLAAGLGSATAFAGTAGAATYYVDCSSGSDSRAGTSTTSAWRTLTKANGASLRPGDSLLLKSGCQWPGPLKARWNGTASSRITIGTYGGGARARIVNGHENVLITGSYQVITSIFTRGDPTSYDSQCANSPVGWKVGFRFMPGSRYNTVQNSEANDQYIGIYFDKDSSNNKALRNTLRDNRLKDPNLGSDAGAVGIVLMGDNNEVAYNTISGSTTCSRFYGVDGAAVEVYGGRNNSIHHNVAVDNNTFTELGNNRSAYNTFAYNEVRSSLAKANFLVTRGGADAKYGPVVGTKAYNNSVYLTGAQSYAIQCTKGCSRSVLSLRNNIVWANDRVGYADAPFEESNNVYWRAAGSPKVYFTISSTSKKVDPRFANAGAGDLRLASNSPAINAGWSGITGLGFTTDLAGTPVPQRGAVDIGARELR